jgi:hypothetical protein
VKFEVLRLPRLKKNAIHARNALQTAHSSSSGTSQPVCSFKLFVRFASSGTEQITAINKYL